MNPLLRLRALKPVEKKKEPDKHAPSTFTWKGVTYAVPSNETLNMSGFTFSSRYRAWIEYQKAMQQA